MGLYVYEGMVKEYEGVWSGMKGYEINEGVWRKISVYEGG